MRVLRPPRRIETPPPRERPVPKSPMSDGRIAGVKRMRAGIVCCSFATTPARLPDQRLFRRRLGASADDDRAMIAPVGLASAVPAG